MLINKPLRRVASAFILACTLSSLPVFAHEDHDEPVSFQLSAASRNKDPQRVILSSSVDITEAEEQAGVINISQIMPTLSNINQQYRIFTPTQFNYFVKNFHYPYRERFDVNRQKPPSQVVLHWTANVRPEIPLYTLSAFLRSNRNGRIVERANRYKNVSNYYLTGSLANSEGSKTAHLVKLTQGDLQSWGDIPRVTAYPTDSAWDDNKYDGRGAIGIEIESPNFTVFYKNPQQREKLHNFLLLTLQERGTLKALSELRESPYWGDMLKLHAYLKSNLSKIDVDKRGGIAQNYQHLDKLIKFLPDIRPQMYQDAKKMFQYVSGHGIVAREYNERMIKAGRPREADYDKIDFTEAHVFVVVMDFLQSDIQYHGQEAEERRFDWLTRQLDFLRRTQENTLLPNQISKPMLKRLPNGRQVKENPEK